MHKTCVVAGELSNPFNFSGPHVLCKSTDSGKAAVLVGLECTAVWSKGKLNHLRGTGSCCIIIVNLTAQGSPVVKQTNNNNKEKNSLS